MRWLCCLSLLARAFAQSSSPNSPASIEGHVVTAAGGEPVRKAEVTLDVSPSDGDEPELVAATDDAGHFRFADLKPGTYKLTAEKKGFLGGGFGQVAPHDPQTLLKISAGESMDAITLRLFPAASISGRVLDAEGDPAENRAVMLWMKGNRVESYGPVDQTTTNQSGEFHFNGLDAGTYFVSAERESEGLPYSQTFVDATGHPTRLRELRTFYPSALGQAQAQSIHVSDGESESGIDIQVERGPILRVSGKVAELAAQVSEYIISASVDESPGWSSQNGRILPTGDFVIEGLPPGEHEIKLMQQTSSGPKVVGTAEVTLSEQDITGLVMSPSQPASLHVRVLVEGENRSLVTGSVSLAPLDRTRHTMRNTFYSMEPQNGFYPLEVLRPGRYRIGFTNPGRAYLKTVQAGGHALEDQIVDIAEGARLDVQLIYSRHLAGVQGDVELPQDQPAKSVHVFVIADPSPSESTRVVSPELDQYLHFSISNLRPGKYRVFAAQEGDFELWENEQFLQQIQSQGVEIDLHEDEQRSVHLKLIPKSATDKARGSAVLKPACKAASGGYSGCFTDPDGFAGEVAWNPARRLAADGSIYIH